MNRSIFVIVVLLCVLAGAEEPAIAACRGGTLNVCKREGKVDCLSVVSSNVCINLIGGPFVSGFSGGNYQCTVFKNKGCGGSTNFVNSFGTNKFTFVPQSLRCPCF